MIWTAAAVFEPALPAHCVPENDFLLHFSSTFHTCVPTPLAFASNLLGLMSIVAWLFAQLPQIYKNWHIQSTSGLSIFFLVEWCLGDLSNLLGALFTHQASWQVAIGFYYTFVDLCLVAQWVWYEKLRHGHPVFRMWKRRHTNDDDDSATSGSMEQVVIEGMPVLSPSQSNESESDAVQGTDNRKPMTRPKIIFRTPTFQREQEEKEKLASTSGTPRNTIHRIGPSSPMPSPSPRTMLFLACLVAMAHGSPIHKTPAHSHLQDSGPTPLENAGTIISWMSTLLYLGSRLPQLFKNWRRKSVAGLSPHLFIAAFCGNLFYSSALLTNPNAWSDFGPYGGGGWAGKEGSDRMQWVLAALPFFLGAAGVLGLDASVGVQFLMYGETEEKLVVVDEQQGSRWHWRRVSGWMRGWVPSSVRSLPGSVERTALLDERTRHSDGYGAL
ncbi:hypothetical protein Slin15195_G068070 [Septoria linicola]|uniref:PQ loop repeat protein n=1 Tax=Septoria linicola TaxID=215465 RepID=A0A9Q9AWQ2_9PEZI|nr:hypothetical protein Slin14017_G100810 [Septoria linicola]USW53488.1 hypothetical protein Slin15195_G068070 [Septoria linicola]